MRAAGLDGRWFMGVGNHEVWADPKIEGVLSAPCRISGSSASRRKTSSTSSTSRARASSTCGAASTITGRPRNGTLIGPNTTSRWRNFRSGWTKPRPMAFQGLHHFPLSCVCAVRARPIPSADNPHKVIASYAKDMEMVVLNGHVHTTEIYEVDGVKYLMLGGGGAEQDPILPGRRASRYPLTIRRTSTGRASLRRRNTTTSSSMSSRARRRNSPSIGSGHGRPSPSGPKNSSNEAEEGASAVSDSGDGSPDHSRLGRGRIAWRDHPQAWRLGRGRLAAWLVLRPFSFGNVRPRSPTPRRPLCGLPVLGAIVYLYFVWTCGPSSSALATGWPPRLLRPQGAFCRYRVGVAARVLGLLATALAERPEPRGQRSPQFFAFIVWWSFLGGHVDNNIMGFGS